MLVNTHGRLTPAVGRERHTRAAKHSTESGIKSSFTHARPNSADISITKNLVGNPKNPGEVASLAFSVNLPIHHHRTIEPFIILIMNIA
jgi:hypothetical protein